MFVCMLASGCVIEIYKLFASGSWTTCRAGAGHCVISNRNLCVPFLLPGQNNTATPGKET